MTPKSRKAAEVSDLPRYPDLTERKSGVPTKGLQANVKGARPTQGWRWDSPAVLAANSFSAPAKRKE